MAGVWLGRVWLGACVAGSMCGCWVCMAGGMHGLNVWRGVCVAVGVCMVGGMHDPNTSPPALLTMRFEVVLQLFFSHGDQFCIVTINKMPNPERANIQDMC